MSIKRATACLSGGGPDFAGFYHREPESKKSHKIELKKVRLEHLEQQNWHQRVIVDEMVGASQ